MARTGGAGGQNRTGYAHLITGEGVAESLEARKYRRDKSC